MIGAIVRMLTGPAMPWAIMVSVVVSGLLGTQIGTWRAEAACAERAKVLNDRLISLTEEKHALELGIAEHNKGVAVAEAQTVAAKAAQAQAEQHAADLASFSQSRLDKLAAAVTKSSTCGEVLKGYWEMRK